MPVEPLRETPSQTAGPYVHIGMLPAAAGLKLRSQEKPWITGLKGETIVIEGTVYDGDREPVRDAVLEIWQADANGKFDTGHAGFARTACDFKTGLYRFETVKPGEVASFRNVGDGEQTQEDTGKVKPATFLRAPPGCRRW